MFIEPCAWAWAGEGDEDARLGGGESVRGRSVERSVMVRGVGGCSGSWTSAG
jgi:hypothetical protein